MPWPGFPSALVTEMVFKFQVETLDRGSGKNRVGSSGTTAQELNPVWSQECRLKENR